MNTTMRFNITLPQELGIKLKASKNRSQLVAESLREKFAQDEAKHLEALLIEGYCKRAQEDSTLNQEYDHMTADEV